MQYENDFIIYYFKYVEKYDKYGKVLTVFHRDVHNVI